MIKRYDLAEDAQYGVYVGEVEYGDFVRYDDYEDLNDKLIDCQVELKLLKGKITDIYKGM